MIYLKAIIALGLICAVVLGVVHIGQTYLAVGQQASQIRELEARVADRDETIQNLTHAAGERRRQQEIADAESQSIRTRNAELAEEGDRLRGALAERLRVVPRACPATAGQSAAVPGAAVAAGTAPAAPTGPAPAASTGDPEPAAELAAACARAAAAADIAEPERNDMIRRYEAVRIDFCRAYPEQC